VLLFLNEDALTCFGWFRKQTRENTHWTTNRRYNMLIIKVRQCLIRNSKLPTRGCREV